MPSAEEDFVVGGKEWDADSMVVPSAPPTHVRRVHCVFITSVHPSRSSGQVCHYVLMNAWILVLICLFRSTIFSLFVQISAVLRFYVRFSLVKFEWELNNSHLIKHFTGRMRLVMSVVWLLLLMCWPQCCSQTQFAAHLKHNQPPLRRNFHAKLFKLARMKLFHHNWRIWFYSSVHCTEMFAMEITV